MKPSCPALGCRTATILLLAAGLLPSCTVESERQSTGAIRAREPVLLTSPASFGYTTRPGDRVIWEGMGELVLTPTTLYLVFQAGNLAGSRSLPISYAAIAEATTGSLSHWRNPPFGSPKQLDHMLLLSPLDGAIRSKGYNSGATRHQLVFNLIDPARTTSLAADQRMVENTDPAATSGTPIG